MSDLIHQKVQLIYTPETLPAVILERFEPGWTAIQACKAVGFIDDDSDGQYFVLFEDGPGPRSGVLVKPSEVQLIRAEGPMAAHERRAPGSKAMQSAKIFLRDRKDPILVHGTLEYAANLIARIGISKAKLERDGDAVGLEEYWARFQRVNKDDTIGMEDVMINPDYVVSLQSGLE